MRYILLALSLLFSDAVYAQNELPKNVAEQAFKLFEANPQITFVEQYNPDLNISHFSVRNIVCKLGAKNECAMDNFPPNENVTPVRLQGGSADQMIALLANLSPGLMVHAGFSCRHVEHWQETKCWSF